MKITKITKIRDLGIFRNFSWKTDLPDFSCFNLIYGWNYSGKTTFSRIFYKLGNPEHFSELEGSFVVLDSEGNTFDSKNITATQKCRVFNRDFIELNFKEEYNAPAVFIIGDDAAKIRERISTLEARKTRTKRAAGKYANEIRDWKRRVEDDWKRDGARKISNYFSERNFDRRNLDTLLEKVKHSLDDFILEDNKRDVYKAVVKSDDEFTEHKNFTIPNIDISALVEEINALLSQTASNNAIEKLKDNPELETWVRTGRKFHSHGSECEFCGNKIQDERIEQLKGHFSTEYESLAKNVEDKVLALQNMEIKSVLPGSPQIIPSVRENYTKAISPISTFVDSAKDVITLLVDVLNGKASSLETEQKLPDIVFDALAKVAAYEYADRYNEIAALLKNHNEQIKDMEATKGDAKTKLKEDLAARFYRYYDIAKEEKKRKKIEEKRDRAKNVEKDIDAQITEKKEEIKKHSVAVQDLNKLISHLLGSNISAVPLEESLFEFQRGTKRAERLSEGERTAIAFAYFLVTLEDGGNKLSETLVFVDDPVSSLDSNHIYAVYALIIERLRGKCKQLFVSTHNYEFLNLLKDEALNSKRNFKTGCAGYLIQRVDNAEKDPCAQLVEMPQELRKFKSEYLFIFSLLYQLVTSGAKSFEVYTVPTVLRKFLETYLGFRNPVPGKWSDKLGLLFDDDGKCREVTTFANTGSHLHSLNQAVEHNERTAYSIRIVKMVLDEVEEKDNDHFEGLKSTVEN